MKEEIQDELNVPNLRFFGFECEWETKKLEKLCFNISSGNDRNEENGIFDLYGSTGIIGATNSPSYVGKYILVARVGANAGYLNRVMKKFGVTDNTLVISVLDDQNIDFIFYNLKKFGLNKLIFGSGQPLVTGGQLKNLKLLFPSSEEQKKISNFLCLVDEIIVTQSKLLQNLETLRQELREKLISGKLKFKDSNGDEFPNWQKKKLSDISEKRIIKNKGGLINKVFSNSAIYGIVNQRDFFDKDIANQSNLEGYYIVENNDFVYNPRISKLAPVGPISRNKLETGVISPLYTVFRIKSESIAFIELYFKSKRWHKHMEEISNYGIRDDRMSFAINDFYKMPIYLPSFAEQVQISNLLSSIDYKIDLETQLLQKLEDQKKYLLANLFV